MIALEYLWIALVFVTMISVLVAAHELGHYLFARLFGMGCEEFAVGFGKPVIFTWLRRKYRIPLAPGQDPMIEPVSQGSAFEGGDKPVDRRVTDDGAAIEEVTEFTVRPWPVGGFVRIKGMIPEDDQSETRIPGGFYSKPPWQRLLVLFAGPAFSIVAGILVLVPMFMFLGMRKPSMEPVLGPVNDPGPAMRAGLRTGDRILAIDGRPVTRFFDILDVVRSSPGRELAVVASRGGKEFSTRLTPMQDLDPTPVFDENLEPTGDFKHQGKMAAGWATTKQRVSFLDALSVASMQPVLAVKGIAGLFIKPQQFEQQVSGPGTMVKFTKDAVDSGIENVLWLAAMLSISVGIMNLLPIPPLDGGQMIVAFAEMLRGGRRLSIKSQSFANLVGVAMVFALMLGAITVDVKRFIEAPRKEAALKQRLEGK